MEKVRSLFYLLVLAGMMNFACCKRDDSKPSVIEVEKPGLPGTPAPDHSNPDVPIKISTFANIGGVLIYKENSGNNAFFYQTGMTIDADGAYRCYHSNSELALSPLEMAGYPGNWWGIVTDENGEPFIQGPDDPAPGYYVSQTALEDPKLDMADPYRYVDALVIPYIVIPSSLIDQTKTRLGDFAVIYNKNFDKVTFTIFADIGPENSIGEASVAAAHTLGYELKNKMGGTEKGITYLVFPGSGNGKKRTVEDINFKGDSLLNRWGGLQKLKTIL